MSKNNILELIREAAASRKRLLGILVDPEKCDVGEVPAFAKAINRISSSAKNKWETDKVILLVGGSTMPTGLVHKWITAARQSIEHPIVIFPGSHDQLSPAADALLFLNLLSGNNPEYLGGQQRKAAKALKTMDLTTIPTTYLLIDGGHESAVQRVTKTTPLSQHDPEAIATCAYAGQLMGNLLTYLEAGSGADRPVSPQIISNCAEWLKTPLIVGGGIKTEKQIVEAYQAGATMVVVGTAIEKNLQWQG